MESFKPSDSKGYRVTLRGGQEIAVPIWSATVALLNLAAAGKYIGQDNLISITELNIPSVMLAIINSNEPDDTTALIKNFVCSARMDGNKIQAKDFDEIFGGKLGLIVEIFAHVMKAQYATFFTQGLAKESSPSP